MRSFWVSLAFLLVIACASAKKKITVGYLAAIKGNLKDRQGLTVSGAVTLALDEINSNPYLLPWVNLVLRWNDTRGELLRATRAIMEMIYEGVAVFFGVEEICYIQALLAQSKNIPMISFKCSEYKTSSIPTFASTEPSDTQVTKSTIALLLYYHWRQFSIIYEEGSETVANLLRDQANIRNMSINSMQLVMNQHECCEKKISCCNRNNWYEIIQETMNHTRIYVFLGSIQSLIQIMNTMHYAQLFDNGEYMVIYVDKNAYSEKEAMKYLWTTADVVRDETCFDQQKDFMKKARSLLVIVSTGLSQSNHYKKFTQKIMEYNQKEPFNFPKSTINFKKSVSIIYAANLYDSVQLYAHALHILLTNEKNVTDNIIDEIVSNGTRIIDTIIKMGTYNSISGTTMHIDSNGNSEGNFSVLAFRESNLTFKKFTCTHQMVKVGKFLQGDSLEFRIISQIDWPGGFKPQDEPSCGFDNRFCIQDNDRTASTSVVVALAIVIFCVGVVIVRIYKKLMIEQEIQGRMWKIDRKDIHNYFGNDIISSPSKLSLASSSASVTSHESRSDAQVFAATGHYKGILVRIKEFRFSKKINISRDVMLEMKLMRDIRHNNINSFIGACVEPMKIFLVTDYCAKGSLYDIIENEDIKLGSIFIASLIHDLIKGMLHIHNSMLLYHGNLKSSNCVVTSRWTLQVSDFGLIEIRQCAENDEIGEHQYYRSLLWKAPELLRDTNTSVKGSQKADIYAFAIILYELIGRRGPFGLTQYDPKEIVDLVKRRHPSGEEPFRPDLNSLLDNKSDCEDFVINCMKDCWADDPRNRPDFPAIRTRLKKMKDEKHRNIMDIMIKYADNLEDLVSERTRSLIEEKMKTEDLLHRILPEPIAKSLTRGNGIEPESFDLVTIYFSDIVGFTAMTAGSTPRQIVNVLNDLYIVFDQIIKGYNVSKVETIGDATMLVSGLPLRNANRHAGEIASMALDLISAVKKTSIIKLRIGIHTGPVAAGVIGLTMPRYCVFGDAVNTASLMKINGEEMKIHISYQCKKILDKVGGYETEERETGLANMTDKTYWLVGATEKAIQRTKIDLKILPPLFCRLASNTYSK